MVSLDKRRNAHPQYFYGANLSEAADILGIDQATLYRKRKKLSLR
jgi:transcriptional regulator of acetoin/glycerol metabolism